MTPDGHYIFAVDFDGTLITGNKWPDTEGTPDFHLFHYLTREQEKGNKVILNTCRTGEHLDMAVAYCEEEGLYFDAVNENLPGIIEAYGSDSRKISADFYIDDKAIIPDQTDWKALNISGMSITEIKEREGQSMKMNKRDKVHGWGAIATLLGLAGIAENITSGRGSFIISAIIFSVGLGMCLHGYTK